MVTRPVQGSQINIKSVFDTSFQNSYGWYVNYEFSKQFFSSRDEGLTLGESVGLQVGKRLAQGLDRRPLGPELAGQVRDQHAEHHGEGDDGAEGLRQEFHRGPFRVRGARPAAARSATDATPNRRRGFR